jgi:hypothetical protein
MLVVSRPVSMRLDAEAWATIEALANNLEPLFVAIVVVVVVAERIVLNG